MFILSSVFQSVENLSLSSFEDSFSYYSSHFSIEVGTYIKQNAVNMMYVIVLYVLVCLLFFYILTERMRTNCKLFPNVRRVLLITAHPDDECMFFGPAIMKLQQEGSQIFVLCLSTGDAYNLGIKRKQELWDACEVLGIPASNILLYKSPHMPDDPTIKWEESLVASLVLNLIEVYEADTVITFDKDGVSGHPNHCSLFYAVASLCIQRQIPSYCRVYVLESINLMRKYSIILDGPISYLLSSFIFVLNWREKRIIKKAMEAHKTQMQWFRYLYVIFSRYMYFNTFKEIEPAYVQLELEQLELDI